MLARNQYFLLLTSTFIGTVICGLLWTGLPVYLNSGLLGQLNISLSGIYSWATFGSMVFSIFGGLLADQRDFRKIAFATQFLSALLLLLLIFIAQFSVTGALLILPFLYFNLSLSMIAETVWILKAPTDGFVRTRLLDRAILTTIAKLSSFSLGPIVFSILGMKAVAACSFMFIFAGVIQLFVYFKSSPPDSIPTSQVRSFSWAALEPMLKAPSFLITVLLSGLLSVPLNPLFAMRALQLGTINDVSIFWGTAGLGSLCAITLMRKTKLNINRMYLFVLALIMAASVQLGFMTEDVLKLFIYAFAYVFCSSMISTQIQIDVTTTGHDQSMGSRVGTMNALMDLGIFLGMFAGSFADHYSPSTVAALVGILLVVRALSFDRMRRTVEPHLH